MNHRVTDLFLHSQPQVEEDEGTDGLIILEENEILGTINSAENSSNSELTNDLSSYLNQLLYSYYTNLGRHNLRRQSAYRNRDRSPSSSFNRTDSGSNTSSRSEIHSSIDQTQQIIDLNFGASSLYNDLNRNLYLHGDSTSSFSGDRSLDSNYFNDRHSCSVPEQPQKYLKITKELLSHLGSSDEMKADNFIIDHQGIYWKNEAQRDIFLQSRQLDLRNFINVKDSFEKSKKNINTAITYDSSYYTFKNFFKHTKPYLVHFQLRNLISSIDKNSVIVSDYSSAKKSFEVKRLNPENNRLDVLIDQNKLINSFNENIKISTLTANNDLVVAGSYTGDILIYNNDTHSIHQDILTTNINGITNFINIINNNQSSTSASKDENTSILFAMNDSYLREFSLKKLKTINNYKFPFAINSLSVNPSNSNVRLVVGDSVNSFIFDARVSDTRPVLNLSNHYDYSFCSDWSSYNDNLIATGNQDGTVIVNDIRSLQSMSNHSSKRKSNGYHRSKSTPRNSMLGTGGVSIADDNNEFLCLASRHRALNNNNNSIRNVRFSKNRNFLVFAETIDNVNIMNLDTLTGASSSEALSFASKLSSTSVNSSKSTVDNLYQTDAVLSSSSLKSYTYGSSPIYDSSSNVPRSSSSYLFSGSSRHKSPWSVSGMTASGQCIQTFGKISGLCVNESEDDGGEVITVGISDDSVGGILQYEYESPLKALDFDFF